LTDSKRLTLAQIAPVYAVSVLMIYGWTILWFFWKLSGWFYFLTIGEIVSAYAYALATNFFESLALLSIPILLNFILPKTWFHDVFVARGTSLLMLGLGYLMFFSFQFQSRDDYPSELINWTPVILILILSIVYLPGRVTFLRRFLEGFADRATIFLYVSLPISVLSVAVLIARNLY
jgi:hypothetical protein